MIGSIDRHSAPQYSWGQNCQSFVLLDSDGLSIKQEFMPPATRELLHFHSNAQQFFFVLKGEAKFYLDDKALSLAAQQGIHVQPGTQHYIENQTEHPLEFLVISQPSITNDRTEL